MPHPSTTIYFFKCSISEDLYGACHIPSGEPLPTPGGGTWLPVGSLDALGAGATGFDPDAADRDIEMWENHWFTSKGPREIYWGPDGPPEHLLQRADADASTGAK